MVQRSGVDNPIIQIQNLAHKVLLGLQCLRCKKGHSMGHRSDNPSTYKNQVTWRAVLISWDIVGWSVIGVMPHGIGPWMFIVIPFWFWHGTQACCDACGKENLPKLCSKGSLGYIPVNRCEQSFLLRPGHQHHLTNSMIRFHAHHIMFGCVCSPDEDATTCISTQRARKLSHFFHCRQSCEFSSWLSDIVFVICRVWLLRIGHIRMKCMDIPGNHDGGWSIFASLLDPFWPLLVLQDPETTIYICRCWHYAILSSGPCSFCRFDMCPNCAE